MPQDPPENGSPPPTSTAGSGVSVVTTGTFDGVHAGHRAVIARARTLSGTDGAGRVVALVFDPSPGETLRPESAPPRLTTLAQRERLLVQAGVDQVVRLNPTPEFLNQQPEEFVASIVREHAPSAWVEGPDFRFGKGRSGDLGTLRELGARHGFRVSVVEPFERALTDQTLVPVRSTMVRWLLAHGRVADATILLCRPHAMDGTVVRGDRRGRSIGFPTVNIHSACMAPGEGVYAGRARLPGGTIAPAAISVGTKPTFQGAAAVTVEAHLLLPGVGSGERSGNGAAWTPLPGLPEYGFPIELEFVAWVREQVRFSGLPALVAQLDRDCAMIRTILGGASAADLVLNTEASHA